MLFFTLIGMQVSASSLSDAERVRLIRQFDRSDANRKLIDAIMLKNVKSTKDAIRLVREALAEGADVHQRDRAQRTPLINAAMGEMPIYCHHKNYTPEAAEIIDILIRAGADVNAKDDKGSTALIQAAASANKDVIRRLLNAGADTTLRDNKGRTVFDAIRDVSKMFCENNDPKIISKIFEPIIKMLERKPGKPHVQQEEKKDGEGVACKSKQKPATELDLKMIDAAHEGNLYKMQEFLLNGANKDAQDSYGWTALFWAVATGNARITNALINARADINIQDSKGFTALTEGVAKGKAGMVQILIAAGADLNTQTGNGLTALMWAKDNLYLANILLKAGALLDVQEIDGYTALMFAITSSYESVAKLLISAGADLNVATFSGLTALMHAAMKGDKGIILELLKANANPYIESFSAKTIRENSLKKGVAEAAIRETVNKCAEKNFFTIMQAQHPNLLKDADIQKALANNKYVVAHSEEEEKGSAASGARNLAQVAPPGGPSSIGQEEAPPAYDETPPPSYESLYPEQKKEGEVKTKAASGNDRQTHASVCVQKSTHSVHVDEAKDKHTIIINELSNKQINALMKDFDSKLLTPKKWGKSVPIVFDYEHIFNTKIKSKHNGKITFEVGHSDYNGAVCNHKDIECSFEARNKGSYDVLLRYKGTSAIKTFFPKDWQLNKVMSKITEALLNVYHDEFDGVSSRTLVGRTSEGLSIVIVFRTNKEGQPTGKVVTAYPN